MNTIQKNTSEAKPGYINLDGNKKDGSTPKSDERTFLNDQKFRNNDAKKKINRFFAGLPFNPEP